MTETVGLSGTPQRAGEGGSLVPVQQKPKITPELQADKNREEDRAPSGAFLYRAGRLMDGRRKDFPVLVGCAGFPPLRGAHMMVCSNRWYSGHVSRPDYRTGVFSIPPHFTEVRNYV